MNKSKISGTNVTVIQSLLLALSRADDEVKDVKTALGETIERIGREVIGEQEGDGQFVISREPDGSFFISWELRPEKPEAPVMPELPPMVEGDHNDTK